MRIFFCIIIASISGIVTGQLHTNDLKRSENDIQAQAIPASSASRLTVEQAQTVLTQFVATHPDHPALSRLSEILSALNEHITTNPNAYFAVSIEQEMRTLIGTTPPTWLTQLLPWTLRAAALIIAYKFIRTFFTDTQIIEEIDELQDDLHEVSTATQSLLAQVQTLSHSDQSLAKKTNDAAQRTARIFNDEVLSILDTHDRNIIILRDELRRVLRILHVQEQPTGCCAIKKAALGR